MPWTAKGGTSWSKGLTKKTDERVARIALKNSGDNNHRNRHRRLPDGSMLPPTNLVHLHQLVRKAFGGKATICENIHCRGRSKKFEWSNKNHDYRWPLVREDWQQLCISCHRNYDFIMFRNYSHCRAIEHPFALAS